MNHKVLNTLRNHKIKNNQRIDRNCRKQNSYFLLIYGKKKETGGVKTEKSACVFHETMPFSSEPPFFSSKPRSVGSGGKAEKESQDKLV